MTGNLERGGERPGVKVYGPGLQHPMTEAPFTPATPIQAYLWEVIQKKKKASNAIGLNQPEDLKLIRSSGNFYHGV